MLGVGLSPLLLRILGFLTDARSWHHATPVCYRLLAAERTTWSVLTLSRDPRSLAFLIIRPTFYFSTLEQLDLSLVSSSPLAGRSRLAVPGERPCCHWLGTVDMAAPAGSHRRGWHT
uniref:Secreted protein n=1 Tax=Zea mays TaxID=4577 RepID=A0A804Q794_MAIZE